MVIEEKIYSLLTADATMITLIGDRVYWARADQETTKPYVVCSIISQEPQTAHNNLLSDLRKWQVQVSCFALSYLATRTIANRVKTVLVGHRDTDGVQSIILKPGRSERTMPPEFDTMLHQIIVELHVMESLA